PAFTLFRLFLQRKIMPLLPGGRGRARQALPESRVPVMPVTSAAELAGLLRELQLLPPAQLRDVARKVQANQLDARALAQNLIKEGRLSVYQVNQLLQGRGRDLVLGAYVLLERLGEGGMGEVFKARHQKMGRIVALKLMRKERLASAAAIKR